MKAIVFSEQGGTEVLRYTDVPKPRLEANEVLVKVEACAVNYLDLHARRNRPEIAEKFQREERHHTYSDPTSLGQLLKLVMQAAVLQSERALFLHPAFRAVSVATATTV